MISSYEYFVFTKNKFKDIKKNIYLLLNILLAPITRAPYIKPSFLFAENLCNVFLNSYIGPRDTTIVLHSFTLTLQKHKINSDI
jgi:hypothetical protein